MGSAHIVVRSGADTREYSSTSNNGDQRADVLPAAAPPVSAADTDSPSPAGLAAAWPEGCVVTAQGVRSSPWFNGRSGCVVGVQGDRLVVNFGAAGTKLMRPGNLRRVIALCHQCGSMGPPHSREAQGVVRCGRCDGLFIEEMRPVAPVVGHGPRQIRELRRNWQAPNDTGVGLISQLVRTLIPGPGVHMFTDEMEVRLVELQRVIHSFSGMWEELTGGSAPPLRASRQAIADLQRIHVKAGERHENCAVCMETPEEGDELWKMPCAHTYHAACLAPWLEERNTCPICRNALPAEPATTE
eukprot:Hpha_TRINITY_DN12871_c0_g1::TRINITY_DN12871_c0_g1_i1::g.24295::m.24295